MAQNGSKLEVAAVICLLMKAPWLARAKKLIKEIEIGSILTKKTVKNRADGQKQLDVSKWLKTAKN